MSDAYDLTQFTVEPDWISETEAEDAARAEFLLIPTGTYEGQITAFETRDGQERGLYAGRPIIHCTVELYGVEGRTRTYWVDVSPIVVHQADARLANPSKLMGHLVKATGTVGKPVSDVMTVALQSRLRFRVRVKPAEGEWKARNVTDAITATV